MTSLVQTWLGAFAWVTLASVFSTRGAMKCQRCLGELNSVFIATMENVLDICGKLYDPACPVVCLDERPCQLIGDTIQPIPTNEGQDKRVDFHYRRNGTAVVLADLEPLTGKRLIEV